MVNVHTIVYLALLGAQSYLSSDKTMVDGNVDIISIFAILCSALLFIAIFISAIKLIKRLKDSPYAILTAFFALSLGIIYSISVNPISFGEEVALVAKNISNLIIGLIAFFGYLYFDSLLTIKPPYHRFIVFFGLIVSDLIIVILNFTLPFEPDYFFYLSAIIAYSLGSLCCIFAICVTVKTFRLIKHNGLIFDTVASVSGFLATIMFQIVLYPLLLHQIDESSEIISFLFWMGNILFILTVVILIVNSLLNGDYVYFIPIPIHVILLYNKGGVLTFSSKFKDHSLESVAKTDTLIGGVFLSISAIIKEILGTKSKLTYINAETYEIFLSPLLNDAGTIVVISSGANLIMKKSIQHFTDAIPDTILSLLNDIRQTREVGYYEKILNPLIKQYFPYLLLKD